jgi:6-pyruvoyl-tetrahydropterin synthase
MYALAVSDHVMIAHSFRGAVFGPAQRLHGATYTVEAEFRRAALDADGLVCDIGRALELLRGVLGIIAYRNLDDDPRFGQVNTTTEWLAGWILERIAEGIAAGGLGAGTAGAIGSLKVTLRESPVAWAACERAL